MLVIAAIGAIVFHFSTNSVNAGLFGSKHTREYKKQKAAADAALKKKQYTTAEKHLLAAHTAARNSGVKNYRFTDSIYALANLYRRFEMNRKAEGYLHMGVTNAVSLFGTNRIETARAWFAHSLVLVQMRRFDAAVAHLERVEHIIRKRFGKYSPALGYCQAVLGQGYLLTGKPDQAAPLLAQGLNLFGRGRSRDYLANPGSQIMRIKTDVFTPNANDVIVCKLDYATALQLMNGESLSDQHIDEAREILKKQLKESHADLIIYNHIAGNYEKMGMSDLAEARYLQALRLTHQDASLTEQQKLEANKAVMGFYARQSEFTYVDMQKDALLAKGISQAEVDDIIRRNNPAYTARQKLFTQPANPTP